MKFYYLIKKEEYNNLIESCSSQRKSNQLDEAQKIEIIKNKEIPNELKIQLISQNNKIQKQNSIPEKESYICLLYTSPSPRDKRQSRMPSSA